MSDGMNINNQNFQNIPQQESNPTLTNDPVEVKPKKRKWLTCLIIIFTIIGLLIAAVILINSYDPKGSPLGKEQIINPQSPPQNWQSYSIPSKSFSIKVPSEFTLSQEGKANDHDGIKLTSNKYGYETMIDVYHQTSLNTDYDTSLKALRTDFKLDKTKFWETNVDINGNKGEALYSASANKNQNSITYYYITMINHNGKPYSIGLATDRLDHIEEYKTIYGQILGSISFSS